MYSPDPVPLDTPPALKAWLADQFRRIAAELNAPPHLEAFDAEPARLHEGLTVAADGINWNPGAGVGVYIYQGGAWTAAHSSQSLIGAQPRLLFKETDSGSDEKIWDEIINTSGSFSHLTYRTRTDADGTGVTWLDVRRQNASVNIDQILYTLKDGVRTATISYQPTTVGFSVDTGAPTFQITTGDSGASSYCGFQTATGLTVTDWLSANDPGFYGLSGALSGPAAVLNAQGVNSVSIACDYNEVARFTPDGHFLATAAVQTGSYTVAALPAGARGDRAMVTNALAPVFGNAVAGGGAVIIPVFHDGAAWKVG